MKTIYPLISFLCSCFFIQIPLLAQVSFTESNSSYTQNFDNIGTGRSLPANWRISITNSSFTWAGGRDSVTQVASSGTPTTGGTYNWGTTAGTDRAVGVMTSTSFVTPNRYMVQLKNDGSQTIDSFLVDFDVERYRRNSATASVNFNYSTTGLAGSWQAISAGTVTNANLPTGTSEYYFANPSPVVERRNIKVNVSLAPGAVMYLAWPITTTGSSNSQGIGLDNVFIRAFYPPVANQPQITISGNGNNISNGSVVPSLSDNTSFGTLCLSAASVSNSFVIKNTGNANLTINSASLTGDAEFSITQSPTATISPGDSTLMEVTFAPNSGGIRSAILSISSNDPLNGTFTFTVGATVSTSIPFPSSLNVFNREDGAIIKWTPPGAGCWDEVLVLLSDDPTIVFRPSGDGSSYSPDNVYAGTGEQIIFLGTNDSVLVTGLDFGEEYTAAFFTRNGTNWSDFPTLTFTRYRDIPDNGCSSNNIIEYDIVVAQDILLTDVNLGLSVIHNSRNQLKISLAHPDNTEVLLINQAGSFVSNFDLILDDDAASNISNTPHTVGGSYDETAKPTGSGTGLLSAFDGKRSQGTWKLRICDTAQGVLGSLVDAELILSGCPDIDQLVFTGLPVSIRQDITLSPFNVRLACANNDVINCNSGNITLQFNGCGVSGTLVKPVINGIATFNDIVFSRAVQNGVYFTATYSGSCGTTPPVNSPDFDITVPFGSLVPTVIRDETFEINSPIPWTYSTATTNAFVDVTGLQTVGGNTFLRKTVSGAGTSSTTSITFSLVENLGIYNNLELFFNVGASIGFTGVVGNDNGENLLVEVQRNGGSFTPALLHRGFGDKKFEFSKDSLVELTPNGNLNTSNTDTSSYFRIDIPGGTNTLRLRVTAINNRFDETWCIDDIKLVGYSPGDGIPDSLPVLNSLINPIDKCSGSSASLGVEIRNNRGNTIYSWTPASGLDNPDSLNPNVISNNNITYQLIAIDADGCKDSISIDIVTLPVASIVNQPGDASACATSFSVTANAASPGYIWQKQDKNSPDWNDISEADPDFNGLNTNILSITQNKSAYDSSAFRCVITENNLCPVTSESAAYYLNPLVFLPQSSNVYTMNNPCDLDNGWTYYSSNVAPGEYLIAINWAPDGSLSAENALAKANADVTITLDDDFYGVEEEIEGVPHATYTMKRYWNVTTNGNPISENVRLRFFYKAEEAQEISDAVDAFVLNYPTTINEGFKWFKTRTGPFNPIDDVQAVNVIEATQLNNVNLNSLTERGVLYAQFNNISSFSGGTGAAGAGLQNTPLPVQLLYFTSNCEPGEVLLSWATASELNAKSFHVERSPDGINFSKVSEISASGNSNSTQFYSYLDKIPTDRILYYRLRQEDFDGTMQIFRTISVNCSGISPVFSSFYHPIAGMVGFFTAKNDGLLKVSLFDATGKLVIQNNQLVERGINKFIINTSGISKGMYILQVADEQRTYKESMIVY